MRVLAILVLAAGVAAADEGWSTYATRDGMTYAKRGVPGSKFNEYRASGDVGASLTETARVVWTAITESVPPTVKKRTVLSRSDDELVIYDQVRTPVVSDRDVTIRIRRIARAGEIEIRFESANDVGPPPQSGYVRLPIVRGHWLLAPSGNGTRLQYECYSEPGGSIPAFIVRSAQQSEVEKDVERVLGRLPR